MLLTSRSTRVVRRLFGTPTDGDILMLPEWKIAFPAFPRQDLRAMFVDRLGETGLDLLLKLLELERSRRIDSHAAKLHPYVFEVDG